METWAKMEADQDEGFSAIPAGQRNLRGFTGAGYSKGRPWLIQAAWFACMNMVFMKWWLPPKLRPCILRLFGAEVGKKVLIRHRVRVLWPWKLRIGDSTWIGEDAWLLNLEPITLGSNVCISQAASLITGSHNRKSPTFEFDNKPIEIRDGAWIAFGATVLRGVIVGAHATVCADTTVTRNVEENGLVQA